MNGCDNFEVRTVLDKNTLRCEIIHEKNYDILSYSFMLIRDGIKVDHVYTALNHYEFFLEDSGVYVVQGYIKTTSRNDYLRSFPVQYFCDAFVQKFDEFLQCKENFSCNNNRKIPLYVKKYPYADFCCIIFKNKKKLSYFLEYLKHSSFSEYYFECNVKNKSIIFSSLEFCKDILGKSFVFSGKCYFEDRFILGMQDIFNFQDILELRGCTGSFSCCVATKDGIELFTDFFNMCRLFTFENNDAFFVCNGYHMLLVVLSTLGIQLHINQKKMIAGLCTVQHQMFMQNFSHQMDIQGVYQLPIYEDISIVSADIFFVKNALHEVLMNKKKMSRDDYHHALVCGKNEILRNMRAVLDDGRFDTIFVDLTGGLDSRVVFGAATTIENEERFCINCERHAGSRDYELASKINSFFKMPGREVCVDSERISGQAADEKMRSYYMGTYYSHHLRTVISGARNIGRFSGALGEVVCRPYYGRNFAYAPIPRYVESETYISKAMEWISPSFCLGYNEGIKFVLAFLQNECESFKQCCNLEKMDLFYLFFRNSYHFDPYFSDIEGMYEFHPIMSRILFSLKHSQPEWKGDIRLQLDIIGSMNPFLLTMDFDDPRDTYELHEVRKKLSTWNGLFNSIKVDYHNIIGVDVSNTIKRHFKKHEKCLDKPDFFASCLSFLHYLSLVFPDSRNNCFLPLYYYVLNNEKNEHRIRFIYNKLASIYDQMQFTVKNKY